MIVTVSFIHSGRKKTFRGSFEEIRNQLLTVFPWAADAKKIGAKHDPKKLADVMSRISRSEALILEVEDG